MLSGKLFDHTILSADAGLGEVQRVCAEAKAIGAASLCVNGAYTAFAAYQLRDSDVKVCTVIGFPLGMSAVPVKCFEAKTAIEDGAQEIDMVINVGAIKDGRDAYVRDEIASVKTVCGPDVILKVIIETCLLTDDEKIRACRMAAAAGADFVKTSTGFSGGGAAVEDVALMRRTVGTMLGVKASGGIRDTAAAEAMVAAGATRLGTSRTMDILGLT